MTPDHLGPADTPDRFAVLRRLGEGSMGVVYEAYDRATGSRIALKTLAHGESRFLADLKREFRLVQSVIHPNLVRLGGLFQGADTWFFTMELLAGSGYLTWVWGDHAGVTPTELPAGSTTVPSLRAEVAATPVRPAAGAVLDRLQHTLPQLGSALVALHAEGLVHRDVKPSNVLVTPEGRVVVLDFGLARAAVDEPHGWTLAGTPSYMAPEQATYGTVTAAADCYAVGVMLYQALTGRLPFVGKLADLIHRKRTWSPVAPRLLAPGVPAELEALCLRLLAPEPEARPTAAEIAAWPHGSTTRGRPPASAPAAAVFVGRARELVRIRAAFDATAGARPTVVVVDGESGIGKTALLREATRRFAGDGSLVLRGRCFEREVTAYAGVDMIMDALVGHLRRLDERAAYFAPRHAAALHQIFPTLAAIPDFAEPEAASPAGRGHEMRLRAAGAFHELFTRVATRYQIVLSIDDAQWLTEASLVLLRSLLAADDPVPLVLLLAARGPDLGLLAPWLETLACPVSRVSLGPLSPAESLELLRHHLAGRDAADLETMAHDSAGHPYLLRELALATDDRASSGRPRVDDVLRDRAARLAPLERTVLDLVCCATAPIGQHVVGAAAGIGLGDLAAITAVLVRQRWAVVTPGDRDGSIWPAHDRVRGALRTALDEPARRALARRLAEAIEANAGNDVEALALQWSLAGDLPRAAQFARLAGDRAMEKLAFERAADLYDLALRGVERDVERAAVLTAMADALAAAGRGSDAAATYLRAAEVVGGPAADDLVLRAADQLIRSGQVIEGKKLLARVLDQLDIRLPASPGAAVRMVLVRRLALRLRGQAPRALSDDKRRGVVRRIDACWLVGDVLAVLDPLRAVALHTQGLLLALDAGEPYRLARSLCTEAALLAQPGRPALRAALARLAVAERLSTQVGSPQLEGYVALGYGIVQLQMGDFDDAQRHLDHAEATFERCPGTYWEIGFAREFALWTLAYRGRLPELTQRLTTAVAICTARGDRLGAFKLLTGPSRVVLLARDEPHQLLDACEMEPLGLAPDEYSFLAFCALFGRVNALLYLGRAADALVALEAARPAIRAAHVLYSQFHRVELAYLRGRAALARASECTTAEHKPLIAMTRASVRALRRERVAWADALAATLDASLGLLTTSRAQAIAGLHDSAIRLAAVGLGGFADAVRWQLQHVLGHGDDAGDPWHGATIVRPDRFAHALAPLPVY
jgi:tetratricopeptide (TPR) repeat protein